VVPKNQHVKAGSIPRLGRLHHRAGAHAVKRRGKMASPAIRMPPETVFGYAAEQGRALIFPAMFCRDDSIQFHSVVIDQLDGMLPGKIKCL